MMQQRQIRMGFLCFFKEQKNCFFSNNPKNGFKKEQNIQVGWVFLDPDYLSILFYDFPLIARFGTSHVIISLIGYAPHT